MSMEHMIEMGIEAVLKGFTEGQKQVQDLNGELSKTSDLSKKFSDATGTQSTDALKKLGEQADVATDSIQGLGKAGIIAGAAIGTVLTVALVDMISHTKEGISHVLELGEQMHNLSQRVGVSVETLSSLQLAAKTNNLSMGELALGLQQFNRHIFDAEKGTGQAAETFNMLGIQLKDASGQLKGTDQMLAALADRFKGMEDGPNKTAIAMQLLGRSGAQLIPLLNEGSAGLARLQEEARKAGIVLDEETAKAANDFNSSMEVLKSYSEGFWMSVATPLVKGLAEIAKTLRDARFEGDGFLGFLQKLAQYSVGVGSEKQQLGGVVDRRQLLLAQRSALQQQADAGSSGAAADIAVINRELEGLNKQQDDLMNVMGVGSAPGFVGDLPVAKEQAPGIDLSGKDRQQVEAELLKAAGYYGQLHNLGQLSDDGYLNSLQALRGGMGGLTSLRLEQLIRTQQDKQTQAASAGVLAGAQGAALDFTGAGLIEDTYTPAEFDKYKREADYRTKMKQSDVDDINKHNLEIEKQNQDMVIVPTKEGPVMIPKSDWEAAKRNPATFEEGFNQGLKAYFESISTGAASSQFASGVMKSIETSLTSAFRTGKLDLASLEDALKDQLASLAAKETLGALRDVFSPIGDMIKSFLIDPISSFAKDFLAEWLGKTLVPVATQTSAATALTGAAAALSGAATALSAAAGVETAASTESAAATTGAATATTAAASATTGAAATTTGAAGSLSAAGGALAAAGALLGVVYGGYNFISNFLNNPQQAGIMEGLNTFLGTTALSMPGNVFSGISDTISGLGSALGFATGTDMIVSQPTTFTAGEMGSERVTVQPLSGVFKSSADGSFVNNGIMVVDDYTARSFKRRFGLG